MNSKATSTRTRVIDAHHHFWSNPTVHDYPWMTDEVAAIRRSFGPDDLHPLLAACGIAHSVLVQTRSSLTETRHFLELAARTDFIAGVVGWVDLADPAVSDTLADLQESTGGPHLRAVRHQVHDEPDPGWLLQDCVLEGLRAVQNAGLAYDLLVRPRELPAAVEVARRLPELRLIVDHLGKPPIRDRIGSSRGELDGWDRGMAKLSECDNLYCKLSGMVTEANWSDWTVDNLRPYVERVLSWYGPGRLMFGSDWPVCLLAASYGEVFRTCCALIDELSDGERGRVLGGNTIDVYRLELGVGVPT